MKRPLSLPWRVAAGLALLSSLVAVGLGLIFILRNPLLLTGLALALLMTGFGAWLIFTGQRTRLVIGWLLTGLGVISLVSLIIAYSQRAHFLRLGILLAATAFYIWCLRSIREAYWRERADRAVHRGHQEPIKGAVLIINPKAGDGRAIKAQIDKRARALGIKVVITKKSDNITDIAERAVHGGAKMLGVSGGDGTLGAVAQVAIKYDLPLVVLPGGTRCHFARDIGLEPSRIVEALSCFYGREKRIDVGDVNGRIFLNNVSLGLYAEIVDQPEYRDNKVIVTQRILQKHLNNPDSAYDIRFTDADHKRHTKAIQVLIGVNKYETFTLLEPGQRHHLDRGELQITSLYTLSDRLVRELIHTLTWRRFFTQQTPDGFDQWTASEFVVKSLDNHIVIGVDGEREEHTTPLHTVVLPKALRIMAPPEGMHTRSRSLFRRQNLEQLWRIVRGA